MQGSSPVRYSHSAPRPRPTELIEVSIGAETNKQMTGEERAFPSFLVPLLRKREQALPDTEAAQWINVWAFIHHGPTSSGGERHLAPFSCRLGMSLTVRRRMEGATLECGRQAPTSGSNTAHCAFNRILPLRLQPEDNALRC